jgi:copper chaperone CopZ
VRLQEIVVEFSGVRDAEGERGVAAALMAVPGVNAVRVDVGEGRAIVTGDAAVADPDSLREAISRAGYEPGDVSYAE